MSGTLARLSGNKDQALQDALGHLAPDSRTASAVPPDEGAPGVHVQVGGDKVVTAVRHIPAQPARYAPWPEGVDARLIEALAARGIEQPYTHQADAMGHALAGRHVVVVTPTASGKTLCYNGAVLSTVLREPGARALYLFPTKALAQDQLAELHGLAQIVGAAAQREIGVFTYDGDTPADARRAIRARASVVLSNPDMLHAGVLPHHPRWARLFENLRYIVIDELHAYRGVFGSHLANVLRRLQRVCRHYGSNPTFICTSATIANPLALAEQLTEQPFSLVAESGAPRGEKFFVLLNPPVVPASQPPADRVRAEPAGHRNPHHVPEGCVPGPAGRHRGGAGLSRRLPPPAASRDRARAAGRGRAGGGVDQRARTRHRHRGAGRVRDGGLPGHDRLHVAARRPRRAALGTVGGRDGGLERAARPVHRAAPVVFLRRRSIPRTSTCCSIT
jgi:hypothetical protein